MRLNGLSSKAAKAIMAANFLSRTDIKKDLESENSRLNELTDRVTKREIKQWLRDRSSYRKSLRIRKN